MKKRREPFLCTYTGKRIYPFRLKPSDINIIDAAHHLSLLPRYTGATDVAYSVAQHSVYVSHLVPAEDALWGLCHDLSEYLLNDVASPLKRTPTFAAYRKLEESVMQVITTRFDLPTEMPASVKEADLRMVSSEKRDLIAHSGAGTRGWQLKYPPYPFKITPWSAKKAERKFLDRFAELTAK